MNIFTNKSLKFQLEINKIRENAEALKIEVAEINRIAKLTGVKPKYVKTTGLLGNIKSGD